MTPAAMSDYKPQSVYATPRQESPLLFEGLTWREFKAVQQLLDRPGYRLSFLDGVLEIRRMSGEPHETLKKRIAALLELYLLVAGFDFTPTGSMTLESEAGAVKREADESYKLAPDRVRPDLVIEVVFTSGGIDKLEAYKRLLIPEVWFWEDGVLVDQLPQLVVKKTQPKSVCIEFHITYNEAREYLIEAINTLSSQGKPTVFSHIDKLMRQRCANYQGCSSISTANGKKFKSFSQFIDVAVKDGKVRKQNQELFLTELDILAA